jgi:hypothetical protein
VKTISSALAMHLAGETQTMCSCWLVERVDGNVYAYTDHDRDLVFDLEAAMVAVGLTPGPGIVDTGEQTYLAASGFTASNLQTGSGLNVDTGEAQGVLTSPSITEADMLAGLWDHAAIAIFQLNWSDLTMGALLERVGHLGEITTERGYFRAEWRGLMQAYQQQLGELTNPFCTAVLGDSRCTKDLTAFTVTGTVDAVEADNMTIHDAARTEPGPAGGIGISSISKADPGIVTLASAPPWSDGDPVMISGCTGMTAVNGTTFVRSLSGATFSLGIDTTAYPTYTGGGSVTPLGFTGGYFEGGQMTITSGANAGLVFEVKSYVPGQWVLQLPAPYPIEVGATYSMVAGCNHARDTCRDTFNNLANFRGLPFLPGLDSLVQVGRHT